jgi:hypothetical protein
VVPGILFSNHAIHGDNPRLLDIAPTVLNVFGVPVPEYMDGRALVVGTTVEPVGSDRLQPVRPHSGERTRL